MLSEIWSHYGWSHVHTPWKKSRKKLDRKLSREKYQDFNRCTHLQNFLFCIFLQSLLLLHCLSVKYLYMYDLMENMCLYLSFLRIVVRIFRCIPIVQTGKHIFTHKCTKEIPRTQYSVPSECYSFHKGGEKESKLSSIGPKKLRPIFSIVITECWVMCEHSSGVRIGLICLIKQLWHKVWHILTKMNCMDPV